MTEGVWVLDKKNTGLHRGLGENLDYFTYNIGNLTYKTSIRKNRQKPLFMLNICLLRSHKQLGRKRIFFFKNRRSLVWVLDKQNTGFYQVLGYNLGKCIKQHSKNHPYKTFIRKIRQYSFYSIVLKKNFSCKAGNYLYLGIRKKD